MQTILCFGDSNTYGYVPGGGRLPWPARYPNRLAALLGPGFRVKAEGLVGRTTVFEEAGRPGRRGLDALPGCLAGEAPDVLVLLLGTNDCKAAYRADAAQIAAGMAALGQAAQARCPGLKVVLVAPAPLSAAALAPADTPYSAASLRTAAALGKAYRAAALANGFAFLDAGLLAAVSPLDGEHLTAAGHGALAGALAALLQTL